MRRWSSKVPRRMRTILTPVAQNRKQGSLAFSDDRREQISLRSIARENAQRWVAGATRITAGGGHSELSFAPTVCITTAVPVDTRESSLSKRTSHECDVLYGELREHTSQEHAARKHTSQEYDLHECNPRIHTSHQGDSWIFDQRIHDSLNRNSLETSRLDSSLHAIPTYKESSFFVEAPAVGDGVGCCSHAQARNAHDAELPITDGAIIAILDSIIQDADVIADANSHHSQVAQSVMRGEPQISARTSAAGTIGLNSSILSKNLIHTSCNLKHYSKCLTVVNSSDTSRSYTRTLRNYMSTSSNHMSTSSNHTRTSCNLKRYSKLSAAVHNSHNLQAYLHAYTYGTKGAMGTVMPTIVGGSYE